MFKQKGISLTSADVVLTPSQSIIKKVAEKYNLTYRDLAFNRSRDARTTVARHEAIHEIKKAFPNLTNNKIGKMFGGMDPASIGYILKKDTKKQGWAAKLPGLLLPDKKRKSRPVPYAGHEELTA